MSNKQLLLKIEDDAVKFEDGGTLYDIHPNDDYRHRCNERCQAAYPVENACAERVVASWNACRGIPTHVLENWQGTDTEGLKPEDWLLNTVTEDGTGYLLASPAGGVMRLTSEQRERIGKALLAIASEQPDAKA